MTTSNSIDFNQTQSQIIEDALALVGVIGDEESVSATMAARAGRVLNRITKHIENTMLHIWKRSEGTLFLQPNQAQYTLGAGSADYATTSYVQTTTTVTVSSGSTITLASVTDISINDNIGILLDSGKLYWTTVSGISNKVVTIAGTIPSSVTSGAIIVDYAPTNQMNKPLEILSCRQHNLSSLLDIPMIELAYKDYQELPTKSQAGSSLVQFAYNRQNTNGLFYTWQMPRSSSFCVNLTYCPSIQDFDLAGNTPDFPNEWLHYLVLELAVQLCPMYGVSDAHAGNLQKQRDEAYNAVSTFDNEMTYLKIEADNTGHG